MMSNKIPSPQARKPVIEWDTCEIDDELGYRLTDEFYYQRESWRKEYEEKSGKQVENDDASFQKWIQESKKKAVQQEIWEDTGYWQQEWEYLLERLQEILNRHSAGIWRVDGCNMGWRHLAGYKYVECERKRDCQHGESDGFDAQKFLRKILPDTDCSFQIYEEGQTLRIVNYHHDAPTGETYVCMPCAATEDQNYWI